MQTRMKRHLLAYAEEEAVQGNGPPMKKPSENGREHALLQGWDEKARTRKDRRSDLLAESISTTWYTWWQHFHPGRCIRDIIVARIEVLIGLVGIAAFLNTVVAGFVWDDRAAIFSNKDVSDVNASIWNHFRHDFWGQDIRLVSSHKSYRPLTTLTFRLNYLLTGLAPWSFHLFNVIFHGVTCMLVVLCGKKILNSTLAYTMAGLLFALHPIHCDAVASIVGRADILCTMLSLTAYLAYIRAFSHGSRCWLVVALLLVVAGTLCKELGITTLGIFVAIEVREIVRLYEESLFVHKKISQTKKFQLVSRKLGPPIQRIAASVIGGMLIMMLRLYINGEHKLYQWTLLENNISLMPFGINKVLSYAHVHAWYLYKLFWPQYLCYDYGFSTIPLIHSVFQFENVLTLIAYMSVIAAAVYATKNVNSPIYMSMAFGICPFIPVSHLFFPVGTILAERLLYFPSVGFCFVFGFAVEKALVQIKLQQSLAILKVPSWNRVVRAFLLLIIIVVFIAAFFKCIVRNHEWRDENSLFESSMLVNPNSIKVLNNLAKIQLNPRDVKKAIPHLEKAVRWLPEYPGAHVNLGIAYSMLERSLHAIQYFMSALAQDPWCGMANGYLGEELMKKWRAMGGEDGHTTQSLLDLAIQHLDIAITKKGVLPIMFVYRGNAAVFKKDFEYAKQYGTCVMIKKAHFQCMFDPVFRRLYNFALRENERMNLFGVDPSAVVNFDSIYNGLAVASYGQHNLEEAAAIYEKGLEVTPESVHLLTNAAVIYQDLGRHKEALLKYQKIIRLDPHNEVVLRRAASAAESSGELALAHEFYAQAHSVESSKGNPSNVMQELKRIDTRMN